MEKTEEDPQPQLSAEEYKNQGNNLLREGKVQEAIDAYSKSIGKAISKP